MNALTVLQVADVEAWRRQLPEIGDGLQAQCHELYKRPTVERCERLLINLDGAQRAIRAFRERLIAEGEGSGQ